MADTICANHRSRREDLESQARELDPIDSPRQARRVAVLLRQEATNRSAEIAELEDLRSPAEDAATTTLSLLRAEATVLRQWARAYDEGDAEAIRRLQIRLGALTADAANEARKYGFDVCGRLEIAARL